MEEIWFQRHPHTWLSDYDMYRHYRCELKLRLEPFEEGVNMAAATKVIDYTLCAEYARPDETTSHPEHLAGLWKSIGVDLLEGASVQVSKAWWIVGDPARVAEGQPAPLERTLLLELRVRIHTSGYTNWEGEFFTALARRLKAAERHFQYWPALRLPCQGPAAGLRILEAECYSWDALDQHPGHRHSLSRAWKEVGQAQT